MSQLKSYQENPGLITRAVADWFASQGACAIISNEVGLTVALAVPWRWTWVANRFASASQEVQDALWNSLFEANRYNLMARTVGSWFGPADLTGVNLPGANLCRVNLSGANLTMADLSWAKLSWANLTGADLSWANLTGADLSWSDLSGANLTGANLTMADLSWSDLSGARWSQFTIWPEGFTPPDNAIKID